MKYKKAVTESLIASIFLLLLSSCSSDDITSKSKLINHMTDSELASVIETEFQLLDRPWEDTDKSPSDEKFKAFDSIIGYEIWDAEDYITNINESAAEYDTEAVQAEIDNIKNSPNEYNNKVNGVIVNGTLYYSIIPPINYDGGKGETVVHHYNPNTGESYSNILTFKDYEDFKKQLRIETDKSAAEGENSQEAADKTYDDMILLYDSIIAGTVSRFEYGTCKSFLEYSLEQIKNGNSFADSMAWEFDETEVESIKGQIKEYHLHDEELDLNFVVHVITPPEYEPSRSYPVYCLTDAVWRFNDVPKIYNAMKDGAAQQALMITVGFEYNIDGWDNEVRSNIFCDKKKEFLDFITDNMMPYLGEMYNFDTAHSVLFGHSQGGVFAHYAAFNFDFYENQPFSAYIIGSPAFWTPYFTGVEDYEQYKNEYGYFDRNKSFDKDLFITGGKDEDEDYSEYYGNNDSTIEGIEHMRERLDRHNVKTYEVKIYPGHHSDYISQMILEYITLK